MLTDYRIFLNSISKGFASAYLPIYHFLFLEYSLPLASEIAARGIHMTAISDFKFIEAMYKVYKADMKSQLLIPFLYFVH